MEKYWCCFARRGRRADVHPISNSSVLVGNCGRVKVRMRARDFRELASRADQSEENEAVEIGRLVMEGCLAGRWVAQSANERNVRELMLGTRLKPVDEETN
ncbi:hypothetical protein KFK09_018428 [Dendrobium nobile]|uniref:Uncharacterized protein n=1 Tax=Dendrobium nobile TaxID=94219 RepID=A0A8T3AV73_DENNO|nr:hypothetical protein KFK09_018428 [Dendrobium nobile]